jgi:guanylate kinase
MNIYKKFLTVAVIIITAFRLSVASQKAPLDHFSNSSESEIEGSQLNFSAFSESGSDSEFEALKAKFGGSSSEFGGASDSEFDNDLNSSFEKIKNYSTSDEDDEISDIEDSGMGFFASLNVNLSEVKPEEKMQTSWPNQKVVVINGLSCSGKSSLTKLFLKQNSNWVCVAKDNITTQLECESDSETDPEDVTIVAIKRELNKGKNVLCDTILISSMDIDIFKENFKDKSQFAIYFLYCPFAKLGHNLELRNSKNKKTEKRSLKQLLESIMHFYVATEDADYIAITTEQDANTLNNLRDSYIQQAKTKSDKLEDYFERMISNKVLKPGCKFKLKLKSKHDAIIHNTKELYYLLNQLTELINNL